MGALEIIGLVLGSSVLTSLVQGMFSRRKDKDDKDESYADRLERRIKTLEERQDILEIRSNIQQSAISCAWGCKSKTQQQPCPVLEHMEQYPMPSFNRQEETKP